MKNALVYINKYLDGNKQFLPHSHPLLEIIYFTSGNGVVTAGDMTFPFSPGTIVCIPPNVTHFDAAEGLYTNIHMNLSLPLANFSKACSFRDNASSDLLTLLELFYHVDIEMKADGWQELSQSLLTCIEWYIYHLSKKEKNRTSELLEVINRRITENLSDPYFDSRAMFENLPASADHVRRLFKKEYDITPKHYLSQKRIDLAKQLLLMNASITQVSRMVGFLDPYYFSRTFKKITGLSPSQYVKAHSD